MNAIIRFFEDINSNNNSSPIAMDVIESLMVSSSIKNEVVHTRDKSDKEIIKCTCGKCFTNETNLSRHFKKLLGKHIACSVCNKLVYSNSDLKRHMVTHSDEKHYSCDKCTASFKLKSELTRHEVVHTGEKKFKCSQCKKSFTQSCDLKRHQAIHNNERKFSCSICSKMFRQKAHLQNHLKTIHKM